MLFQSESVNKELELESIIARLKNDVDIREQENSYLARKIMKDAAKLEKIQKQLQFEQKNQSSSKTKNKSSDTEYELRSASKYFKS